MLILISNLLQPAFLTGLRNEVVESRVDTRREKKNG